MKPMLASDYVEAKLKFPLLAQPKIDGVRGLNLTGALTGRSLKPHANKFNTAFYSVPECVGFDGEFAAHASTNPILCRLTTSAMSTIEGEPYLMWWLFDFITNETKLLPYEHRYNLLVERVNSLRSNTTYAGPITHCAVVPSFKCENIEQLLACDAKWLDEGYEGTIIRDPNGKYKEGRSTAKEGGLLRIKRFTDAEAVVTGLTEGQTNANEAQTNELGRTFRTSHMENMIPNGMIGNILGKDVADGRDVTISPGCMSHEDRIFYFQNPHLILGKVIKYKHFDKGVKDKPRFPTFQCFRSTSDMGGE